MECEQTYVHTSGLKQPDGCRCRCAEPRVPEVVQSGELAIERERCGTADTVDSMDYAADALTKVSLPGAICGKPSS